MIKSTRYIAFSSALFRYVLAVVVCLIFIDSASASQLRSPWDFAPAPAMGNVGTQESRCPSAPKLSANLSTHGVYADKAGSVVDASKKKSYRRDTASFRAAAEKIVELADAYRITGDTSAALCAAQWLNELALDNALGGAMKGIQSHFVQAWMLNAYATAWLKVRPAIDSNRGIHRRINKWLEQLASSVMMFNDKRGSVNNLRYWAGLAVMNAGIAADNREAFNWAVQSFNIGIMQIQPDGSLPREMKRASLARHYHMYAAGPLVIMAELGEANGLNLYKKEGYALSRLVKFIIRGVDDPSIYEKISKAKQRPLTAKSLDFLWLPTYARRFPDKDFERILSKFPRSTKFTRVTFGGLLP